MAAKPGLEQGAPGQGRGAPVHLLEQAALVQDLQVAPDRHVRDAQLADEVGHPDAAILADALEDVAPGAGGLALRLGRAWPWTCTASRVTVSATAEAVSATVQSNRKVNEMRQTQCRNIGGIP